MVIFKNRYFEVTENNGTVYIRTVEPGFLLKDFDTIVRLNPRIKLTNFAVLKKVLNEVTANPVEIGTWLPSIIVEVARDKMSASLFVYETLDYIRENVDEFQRDVKKLLEEHKITHGILDINLEKITSGKAILIAQGTPPTKGEDAQITYLSIPERKPVIKEDGKADYFDMNFIFEIDEDAWLGEKIHAAPGTPGTNVYGEPVAAQPGRDIPLKYDRKSAYEVEEQGKTVLRSKIGGVCEDNKGILSVNHHLPINGDVGVETGNIEFNGSISIRGAVQSGYSVIANGDISIEGLEGVSGAKLIKSIDGDIYIRGGIFGMNQTRLEAGGNIYVKHVNEAKLVAAQDIHIGFYALGSHITGHSIFVDERKGKIIGGTTTAKSCIVAAITGNRMERRTELIINSINKAEGLEEIQTKAALLKTMQEDMQGLEEQINRILPVIQNLTKPQLAALEQTKQKLGDQKDAIFQLDREIKQLMHDLRTVDKEEIQVTKEAYPGTYIQIGKKSSLLSSMTNGRFLIEFGELNV